MNDFSGSYIDMLIARRLLLDWFTRWC